MVIITIIPIGNLLDKPESNNNIVENNNFNHSNNNINKEIPSNIINIDIENKVMINGAKNRIEDIPMMIEEVKYKYF